MDVNELSKLIIENIKKGIIEPDLNKKFLILLDDESEDVKKQYSNLLLQYESSDYEMNIWLYSMSLAIYKNPSVLKQMIMYIKSLTVLNYRQKYFLFQQINSIIFKYPIYNTEDIIRFSWGLLEVIKRECLNTLNVKLNRIPKAELNGNISLVLVEQYLTKEHGPTKTALDRCFVLKKVFGQNVMLVNTAELLSPSDAIYIEDIDIGNYLDILSETTSVEWQGESFNFYQCKHNMPSDEGILELIGFVKTIKPSSIVLVGGTSLVAGILNELVPVLTVGTIQSGLAITLADYQIIDKNMLDNSYSLLERMGKNHDHIIQGKFTFSLKPQISYIDRNTLGIRDNQFALAVVGGRLTDEVTDDFLDMLEECVKESKSREIVIGVIGTCRDFDEKLARHRSLDGKMINIGFVSDILSVIENFDLYVNPKRRGGGTSAVEAISKGIPVISLKYGDVAGIVGDDFCVDSYEEMKKHIIQYINDKNFYNNKSKEALEIANVYLDSVGEFKRIMLEYYKKQGFSLK